MFNGGKLAMNYFFYIIFGFAPSVVWLLYYLRKDVHPESNRMVLKIFLYGMLIGIPAVFIEKGIAAGAQFLATVDANKLMTTDFLRNHIFLFFLYNFLGVAFIEEFLKYLVVREKVLKNPELDEPTDIILYMIIAALGFAAIENLGFLATTTGLFKTVLMALIRFLGATFLHALCSGLMGYFLILSFYEVKKTSRFIFLGLASAAILHGLYNIFIIKVAENFSFIILPIIIIIGLALLVSFGFKKAKTMAGVCKIE